MRTFAIVAALVLALPVAAKTLNVGPGAAYTEIQSAVTAASSGDIVSVAAGYYQVPDGIEIGENNVTLKGAGADQTILDGEGKAYAVVSIKARDVTVTGFTLKGGSSHGFYISGDYSGNLHHNVITANEDRGILLGSGTPTAVMDHNTFASNSVSAIYSYRDDPKTRFTNNIVYQNGRALVTDSTVTHMTVKYNCFYGQTNDDIAVKTSKTNFKADPLFVDATEDFHLQDGSPCLGKGEKESDIGALGTGKNPVIEKPVAKVESGKYRVVVYANDQELGEKVVNVLKAAGYATDDSYVADDPNADANIKYGSATSEDVKAMRKLISVFYEGKLEEKDEFDSDDEDVFINLP